MQKYKSHKTVEAAKIKEIARMVKGGEFQHGWLTLEDGKAVELPQAFFDKHCPVVDGYFVQHEDGYQSYAPAAVFESNYSQNGPCAGAEVKGASNGLKAVLASFGVDLDNPVDDDYDDDEEEYFDEEDLLETLYAIEDRLTAVMTQNEKILNLLNLKVVTLGQNGGIMNCAKNSL